MAFGFFSAVAHPTDFSITCRRVSLCRKTCPLCTDKPEFGNTIVIDQNEDHSEIGESHSTARAGSLPPDSAHAIPENLIGWRNSLRKEFINQRLALPANERLDKTQKIIQGLDSSMGKVRDTIVSLYWPFKGEPNLLDWMKSLIRRGARVALPVVVEKHQPLVFRTWAPGEKLEGGIWNIPVPVDGKPVTPAIVIAPLVGFDVQLYRLGYGGGYFDRTLQNFSTKPLVIGVGYELTRLPTIFPQSYDVPMDLIVTDDKIHRR